MDDLANDDELNKLKKTMGITYQDNVVISPDKLPNYKEKVCVVLFFANLLNLVHENFHQK